MARVLIGLFIVLHGLVHLWYLLLSHKLVAFRPEMGWTGRSWVFTGLLGDPAARGLASIVYGLTAVVLVVAGLGVVARAGWEPPALLGSAALSALVIVLFWDGSLERVGEKGLFGLLISLAILGVTVGTARYRSEMQAARERLAGLGSQVMDTACGPIEFAQVGDGYPVLVIHGNGGGFDQGLGLAQGYLAQGFQVIAPSRFGYLRSPLPAGATPALQADTFVCLLDALGVRQVAVLTSSAGVTSALQLALRHPTRVSALILHSPNAPGQVEFGLPPRPVFAALLRSDFAFWTLTTYFGASMQALVGVPDGFALTQEEQAEVQATLASVLPVSARARGMVFDTYVSNPDIQHYPVETIQTPTLVISAVDDPMTLHRNSRALAEQMPKAQFLTVSDGGHMLLGHTAEVRAEITQFLRHHVTALEASP